MSLSIHRPAGLDQKPDAVLIDTDNTLYPYEPAHKAATEAAERKACKLLGVSLESFRAAFGQAREQVNGQLAGTASSHSRLLYFQRTIEILGMRTQLLMTLDIEQTYWRTFLNAADLFPNVREFILDLRSSNIRTAVITDLTAQIQFRKLIYFGLDDLFDYVVTSEEAGADKPAEAPFRIALEKLRVQPERCWMVGDSPTADLSGARAFNMIRLQKRHAGVKVATGADAADAAFDDFGELRRHLADRKWLQPFDSAA